MITTHPTWAPFLDWYEVSAGGTAYERDGRGRASEGPQGVKLSVQPATKSEPVLVIDRPWEGSQIGYVTALCENGRYRMWYRVREPKGTHATCYAESGDGFEWDKPSLGLHERGGCRDNNIVYPKAVSGAVFRDPSADDGERYKLVDMEPWAETRRTGEILRGTGITRAQEEYVAQGMTLAEIYSQEMRLLGAVVGAVSPDGLRWTRIEEPLFEKFCDTQNVACYDEALGRYVGFWRSSAGGRRCIARSETDDFRHWPAPTVVLQPDCQDAPSDDYYTNAYCPYPGGGFHLMFPSIYHRTQGTLEIRLAVSRDGLNWAWPERKPIVPLGPEGSRDSGELYAGPGLCPLSEERWGLIHVATDRRHNEDTEIATQPTRSQICWATWQRHRLVALEAPVHGQVSLNKRTCREERMLLNYKAARNGWIRVELAEPTLKAIDGYRFHDCEPLRGDSLSSEVRWKGSADLSAFQGRELCVRIQMYQAKLFAISV